jgi:M6 family metalloprotease-like protein
VGVISVPTLSSAERQSAVGLNQRVLVLCGKLNDVSATRKTAAQWVTTLTDEVNPFYLMATYGKTSFTFETVGGAGAPADGWFTLPWTGATWPGTTAAVREAIRLADPYVNMARYNRVFLIVNSDGFGGQCTGYQWMPVNEGRETIQRIDGTDYNVRLMSTAAANEWQPHSYWAAGTRDEAASVIAHELGHELEIPIHYSDIRWSPNSSRDSVSPWDVMGLSPTFNNITCWAKEQREWLSAADITPVGPPTTAALDRTLTLQPIHATSGRRGIKVPFSSSSPFNGYYLEYRKNVDLATTREYWGSILNEGVLVSLVNERPEVEFGNKSIVMYNPAHDGDLYQATLRPGESFTDAARNITITCVSIGGTASVRVQYGLPPTDFDPAITPWNAPPYETADIWVDSEQNGWGNYRYTDPATGRPIGNGDPAWVRHMPDDSWKVNRVYVRVRNYGLDTASNVQVNVYVNDPPGLGDRGANWALLGTINIPTLAGGANSTNYVNWAPQVDRHTCLRAVIVPYAGERTGANNVAQENVSNFETTASSPYKPMTLKMRVQNPTYVDMPVELQISGIPKFWKWEITPATGFSLPSQTDKEVTLTVYPPNPAVRPEYAQGQIFRIGITSLMLHGDAFYPVGGVEMWTHLVYKAAIELTSVTSPAPNTILVKGKLYSLQPTVGPLDNRRVAVLVVRDDKQKASQYVKTPLTNADGNFVAKFENLPTGNYTVEGSWAGDMKFQSGETAGILIGL